MGEGLGGNDLPYNEGKDRFCAVIRHGIPRVANIVELGLQRGICSGESCDFYVSLGVNECLGLSGAVWGCRGVRPLIQSSARDMSGIQWRGPIH